MIKRITKKSFPFLYAIIFILIITTFKTLASSDPSEINKKIPEKNKVTSGMVPDEIPGADDWMHNFHSTISNSVYQSAVWFDGFFSHEDSEQLTPQTTARIRLAWEPRSRDLAEFNSRFRVKVKLPHFKDKLDLILSDDSDDELSQLPLETIKTKSELNDEPFAAAVRLVHVNTEQRFTDTRLGLSGGDIFIKTRHKRRYSWENVHGFKVEP